MLQKILLSVFLSLSLIKSYSQDNFILRNAVEEYLLQSNSGFHFALLAEAYIDSDAVAFFWPCIMNDELVDDKILAVAFEKAGEKWSAYDMFYATNTDGKEKFNALSEGKEFSITKPNGIHQDSLATFIYLLNEGIRKMLASEKSDEAISMIESLSRAFSIDQCVFSNTMTGFVMKGMKSLDITEVNTSGETGTANMEVFFQNEAKQSKLSLKKQGSDWVIDGME